MTPPATIERRALPVLLLLAALALGWILLPFFGTLLWGVTIALLFAPLHRRLLARLPRWRTLAALLTLGVVLLIAVLPFALLTAALTSEATQIYQRLQSGELDPAGYFRGVFDALPGWITNLLDRFGLVDFDTLQRRLNSALAQGSQFIAGQAYTFGQGTFEFIASLGITLYLAFFGLRDGGAMVAELARASPLSPAHTQALFDKFNTVIGATVKGNLLVAVIQGTLGGLAFWALGVGGALLWAVLMAFLSLLPAVGAGLVWAPVAAYFFVTGALWQGVVLVAFGVLVIGLVDNLLRPVLVGKTTLLPDFVVMITTLGGMAVFGLNGFVIGPVIAALFFALWQLFIGDRKQAP
jgi:predicted PurR-regulated permease PerM